MAKGYALYKGEKLLTIGTVKEIAKEMGVSGTTIRKYKNPSYIERTKDSSSAMRLVELRKEYALYKGDDLLSIGTLTEISEDMGVKIDSLLYYATPTYSMRNSEERGRRLVQLDFDVE